MSVSTAAWPTANDYVVAIKDTALAFPGEPELASGTLRQGPTPYLPWVAAGASAVVFSITTATGRPVAVRCFTRRPHTDVDERYLALGAYLRANPCPPFAGFEWKNSAITVQGCSWPILLMEWVEGSSLKEFVQRRLSDRDGQSDLHELCETWADVVSVLERQRVAHGDLQHGNVMVSAPSKVRLVDLDDVYCTSTDPFGADAMGLPAYQHPDRATTNAWNHEIDRFSTIVIYASLRALAVAPRPEEALAAGDELVLHADDLLAAKRENATDRAWRHLLKSPAREVQLLAKQLHDACRGPIDGVPTLSEVIERSATPTPPPPPPPSPRHDQLNTWPPIRVADDPTDGVLNDWDRVPSAPAPDEQLVDGPAGPPVEVPVRHRTDEHLAEQSWAGDGPPPHGEESSEPEPMTVGRWLPWVVFAVVFLVVVMVLVSCSVTTPDDGSLAAPESSAAERGPSRTEGGPDD